MDRAEFMGHPRILKDIFQTLLGPATLRLVEYADGGFGILRNHQPVEARIWRLDELEICIDTYQHLCKAFISGRQRE